MFVFCCFDVDGRTVCFWLFLRVDLLDTQCVAFVLMGFVLLCLLLLGAKLSRSMSFPDAGVLAALVVAVRCGTVLLRLAGSCRRAPESGEVAGCRGGGDGSGGCAEGPRVG